MARLIKLLVGGAIVAFGLKNRAKIAGLLGAGQSSPEPDAPSYSPAPAPPVANVDVAGPPENTATAVPAPDPLVTEPEGAIDEHAEEDAAAAEAANIGGGAIDYPDVNADAGTADEATAPLAEAGEGVSEGEEIADADVVDAVEDAPPPAADTVVHETPPPPPAADTVVRETPAPETPETPEASDAAPPPTGPPIDLAPPPIPDPPADKKSTTIWKNEEQPTVEQPAVPEDGTFLHQSTHTRRPAWDHGQLMGALVGTLLNGRYRLDAQIGAGGMSTVYRAFDTTLERTVAVKVMHREIASDSDQLERFRREARAVAQFSHPHIVGVIDAGEDDGRPYIVFEYVEGETLKDRIRRCGKLPVDESLAYAIEITRALDAAHSRGIVHRDIKPQNVLIDEEGMAKVTDFGIARSLEEDGLTADGRVLGTTDYVSPEQALGHVVNGQSDIYSLGIVFFEMLTGDVPFHGENQVAVAMKHVREEIPDVQRRRPEVSASVAAVLDRMTCKQLERRTPDALTLEDELEEALALEAARQGRSTGEATAVIRTLPPSAKRRLPVRLRSRNAVLVFVLGVLGLAVVLSLVLIEGANRIERGTGAPQGPAPTGTRSVSVPRGSAVDYDPYGDKEEHADETARAVDTDPATFWSTEDYTDHVFIGSAGEKPGVGLYVDAKPEVAATAMRIQTPKPGWTAKIYAAPAGEPPASLEDGWTEVGGGQVTKNKQNFELDTKGERYRYYLVWITSLPPEPDDDVQISEVSLFQDV